MKVNIKIFSEYICRQLKYQHRIRNEIRILLEVTVNAFKYMTVQPHTKILTLAIVPLSFIYNYHSLWI